MRRIARMIAASIVVILGLALVSAAAFSPDIVEATLPEAPESAVEGDQVAPLDPNADNPSVRKIAQGAVDIFGAEFGKRGNHEVTVSMSGPGYYAVHWRDGKVDDGAGTYNRTRTVKGGFPLALIAVNSAGRIVTCTVTIDGIVKDRQTTSAESSIIFCEG